MRRLLMPLCAAAALSACAHKPSDPDAGELSGKLVIPYLAPSVDPATGRVEVSVTVKNGFAQALKTVRLYLAVYDNQGTKISTQDVAIEILGPIKKGQTIGPLEKVTELHDSSVGCVQVRRVEAVGLDYSQLLVEGPAANNLVGSASRRHCPGSAGS